MDFINLLATAPSGVWETIIMWIESWAGTYILSIILLTLVIKVLWTPLDFINRKTTSKQTEMTTKLKPEIDRIQKKYANDKSLQNQKLGELYKKNNFNMMSGCLFMVVYLGLNMFIFFSLFAGLGAMSQYKITQQYDDLKVTYANELHLNLYGDAEMPEFTNEYKLENYINEMLASDTLTGEMKNAVILKVQEKYEETTEGFLWIGNIWKGDVPWTDSVPTFDEYSDLAKLTDAEKISEREIYESFMNPIRDNIGRPNGYLLCTILAAGAAFLSTWLMSKNGNKNATAGAAGANKVMLFFLPGLMGIFALTTNSVFALYLITSQLVTVAFTPLINMAIKKLSKKEEENKKNEIVVEYSRKK